MSVYRVNAISTSRHFPGWQFGVRAQKKVAVVCFPENIDAI